MEMGPLMQVVMQVKKIGFVCTGALLLSGAAWAHHSHANYEATKVIQVTGTVSQYEFVNPHTWVYLTVMGKDGQPEEWTLESGSTGQLLRRGWKKDSMKPGDKITAHIKPLKDGSNGGVLGVVVLADGTNLCDPFGDIDLPGTRCAK
jgi:hypothetical protein